jgi:hypothetical protein
MSLSACARSVADRGGAAVLPDDGVANGFSRGLAIPHHGGLALVGDADGGDVGGLELGFLQGVGGDAGLRGPDFLASCSTQPGLREDLAEFLLGVGDDAAVVVEDDGA